ncbi:MAG TPA: glucose-6-phosphate dehydrogenase [Acidimicrobiales bacterium]|nr:glucose-6-phosphate dehydrogenase [Acidimicrobiales bacterium]
MNATRFVILGAGGDLTGRYLLRALAELAHADALPAELEIVGVSQDAWDDEQFRVHAAERLLRHARNVPAAARQSIVARLRYIAGDVTDRRVLGAAVAGSAGPIVAYLALPPVVFAPTIAALGETALDNRSRIVVEKPFGTDLASAVHLNTLLHAAFDEAAVFRMDHFLGKQTVQNIVGLRFANRLFEPLWCSDHIERVEIVWDETVALESRAGYYDQTGALLDMIQNHLLQLVALVAMERPLGLGERPLRDAKVNVLRAIRPLTAEDVARDTVRARYTAGGNPGRWVPEYASEEGVDPGRETETFASVTLFVDHARWQGVPFHLRTGKALDANRREIRIHLRSTERLPFGQEHEPAHNVLTLTMDPDRLIADIALNGAGDPFDLEHARWELELAPHELSAYARLLRDVITGDPSLSIRADEAEESWRVIDPIIAAWNDGVSPLMSYPARSRGPAGA